MDFEKIKTDFEKRYDRKCERIFFAGQNIIFFSKNGMTASGCLSIGEAMAVAPRDDGRITVQFSGSDDMVCFNVSELERYKDYRLARILIDAEKCGIKLGGGDIFIFKNSRITDLLEPLVLGGLTAFCCNVPAKEKLLSRFENFPENLVTLSGRRRCITVFDGQRLTYLPFFRGEYKIVIAYSGQETKTKIRPSLNLFDEALLSLKRGDAEKFGALLSRHTESIIKENRLEKSGALFESSCRAGDGTGCGIVDGGGIFSLVENSRIDSFVHDVSARYQKYHGGVPDFYVTDFVDSGIFAEES